MVNKFHNYFRRLCAFLIGIVYVLSGTFKLMDPMGTSIIVSEYWNFFHLGFMRWSSYPLGLVLALAETGLGLALVTGLWRRIVAYATFAFQGFFTLISIILLIWNPVMDCGCFGEVIHLTHLQTFFKNIVLVALALAAFLPMRDFGEAKARKYVSFGIGAVSSLLLLIYAMIFLPFKDHTDFTPGAEIMAARSEAEDNAIQASFVYEKDGVEKVFTLDEDLPDTTWHFVRTETVGTLEKSADLTIRDLRSGEYVDSIAAQGNVLVVSYFRGKKDPSEKAHRLLWDAESLGYTPICLTVAGDHADDEFCYGSDRRTLLALNRSNGGVTLIQDGLVVRKWPRTRMPSAEDLALIAAGEPLETLADTQSHANTLQQSYLLYLFTVLLLL